MVIKSLRAVVANDFHSIAEHMNRKAAAAPPKGFDWRLPALIGAGVVLAGVVVGSLWWKERQIIKATSKDVDHLQ